MAKVLVTEEDEIIAESMIATVRSLGYETVYSPGGLLAKEILQHNPDFALAIVSTTLKDIDGRSLVRDIREELEQFLPVIISSGQVSIHDIEELLLLGASYFLAKPFEESDLKEYLMRILSKSHQ